MLSFQDQRQKRPTYIAMKNAINIGQKQQKLQKLGGAIKASIDTLKRLKTQIIAETEVRALGEFITKYQKQNRYYNQLQKSLAQIDEKSDTLDKIINMNKQFIEGNNPKQLEQKISFLKSQKKKNNSQSLQMNILNQQFQAGQQFGQKLDMRKKLLQDEKQQLDELQRIVTQINKMTQETSTMILEQGMKLKIAATTMSRVRDNLQDGRVQLQEANQYQQDTNKKLISFCILVVLIVCIVIMIMYSSKKSS